MKLYGRFFMLSNIISAKNHKILPSGGLCLI
ncbi:hypothetical protein N872_10880 [Neisseria meningitidis LNP27256]|nr:hypothetical protein N872_10880 [Neisseria meningitidis LNP27256]